MRNFVTVMRKIMNTVKTTVLKEMTLLLCTKQTTKPYNFPSHLSPQGLPGSLMAKAFIRYGLECYANPRKYFSESEISFRAGSPFLYFASEFQRDGQHRSEPRINVKV